MIYERNIFLYQDNMTTTHLKSEFKNIDLVNGNVCKTFKTKQKFNHELEFLQELQHLDSVVKLIDYNEKEKKIYLEYLPYSLDKLIKNKELYYKQKIYILIQICKYIIDSHELGIAHNDLKSKNIMLDKDYELKVIDYDLASWNDNPHRDIKQFKFLAIQMLFDIDYTQSYKKYDSYVDIVPEDLADIFETNDIYAIHDILECISV